MKEGRAASCASETHERPSAVETPPRLAPAVEWSTVNIDRITPLGDSVRDDIEIDLLRPRWMRRAACRDQGFTAWFPTEEPSEEADAARHVCSGCGVRAECLDYALAAGIRHGLWGGLSAGERAALVSSARAHGKVTRPGRRARRAAGSPATVERSRSPGGTL